MSDILSEGLIAVPEHMFRDAMQNIVSHVLSWALTKTKTKAQEKEVWRLADKYDCELWHEYSIDSPVKVDHLKLDFSDIPEHYPEKHHDDVYTAVDWRQNHTAAAWHKSKKVILIYPMSGPRPDLMYWPSREHALEDFLDEAETSVRHELRHAIQTILLPDAQNAHTYTDAVNDPVSYATSPNEFDPTIGTLADNFVRYYKALIGYGKKPDVPKMIRQAVGMLPPEIGESPDRFFKILRKEDPVKYRLAVKKFSAEVMKLMTNQTVTEGYTMDEVKTIRVPVGKLAPYAVHNADQAGVEMDPAREAENKSLRDQITKSKSIPGFVTLDIDLDRGFAQIADGNHRTVMANSIDPNMMVQVKIRHLRGTKRPFPKQVRYDGRFGK